MKNTAMGPRDVARTTGVSTDTLRHYERHGLLPGITRTASGYRRYPGGIVERVLLIQRALVVGFSLADLKRVLSTRDKGGVPCRSVRELVGKRFDELDRRIEELSSLREEVRVLLGEWDKTLATTPQGQRAHLLETLGSKSSVERTRRDRNGSMVPARRDMKRRNTQA